MYPSIFILNIKEDSKFITTLCIIIIFVNRLFLTNTIRILSEVLVNVVNNIKLLMNFKLCLIFNFHILN